MNAAVTLSLSGPFARQGLDAAQGLTLWAEETGVRLTVVDDGGSRRAAIRAYGGWLDAGVELLLGPYSGGLVRAVAPLVCGAGRPLWNHGGSADDLPRPGLVSLPAPASTYFHGAVDEAAARRVDRLLVARGAGPFVRAVAEGAVARASAHGLLGPVQWWPTSRTPQVGPSGADFAAGYRRRVGHGPSYVAAQAAAAGCLALAAHGLGLAGEDLPGWRTSTLLGDFALDGSWRQVGHRVTTIRWRGGRMVPLVPRPGAHGGLD